MNLAKRIARLKRVTVSREMRTRTSVRHLRYAAARDVIASVHPDGLVLLNIRNGRVLRGNRTASQIWEGLMQGLTIAAIAQAMCLQSNADEGHVAAETAIFAAELVQRRLVSISRGSK